MSGFLTTHVLDTARGCPAAGMKIDLFKIDGETRTLVRSLITNADGRTDSQILPETEFTTGTFELVFFAGAYFDESGLELTEPKFLKFRCDLACQSPPTITCLFCSRPFLSRPIAGVKAKPWRG